METLRKVHKKHRTDHAETNQSAGDCAAGQCPAGDGFGRPESEQPRQPPGSAPSRAERILRIAAEHNYRPNLQARILRGDSGSNLIGVLINARISQFFYDLLLPLEVELRKRHRRMIIGQLGNDAAEAESVLQNFIDYNLDGVIVLHHDISDGGGWFNHYLPLCRRPSFSKCRPEFPAPPPSRSISPTACARRSPISPPGDGAASHSA